MKLRFLFPIGVLCMACGSSGESSNLGTGGSAGAAGSSGAAGSGGGSATTLSVVIQGSTATYPHQDKLASQTARNVTAGVSSLELIDDQGGRFVLYSGAAVSVSYDDGASTKLGTLNPSDVRPGHYVQARLVQDWSRFDVDATLHDGVTPTAGKLSILQITSEGVSLDGKSYAAGDYEHTFASGGSNREFTGVTPIPSVSKTAEAEAKVENGAWAVYFPLDLTVTPTTAGTLTIVANLDRAFRWTDLPTLGYQPDVYDIAPPLYEIVEQFGANRFEVSLTP